jgi:hypothetical protein
LKRCKRDQARKQRGECPGQEPVHAVAPFDQTLT